MYLKVMVSPYYNGGAWEDDATRATFDPEFDKGKVICIPRELDTTGIMEAVRKNYLLLVDATQEEYDAPHSPTTVPEVQEVTGKHMSLEVSFDRPVFPVPGKKITVPTKSGDVVLDVTNGYMEAHSTAVYYVDATGKIKIEAGAFLDEAGVGNAAYGAPTTIPVTGVTVSPKTVNGKPGDTAKITATVAPADATNKTVTFTSDKPAVVTVDNSGNYTLVADGTATITAKTADGNKVDTVAVTVTTPVEAKTVKAASARKKTVKKED